MGTTTTVSMGKRWAIPLALPVSNESVQEFRVQSSGYGRVGTGWRRGRELVTSRARTRGTQHLYYLRDSSLGELRLHLWASIPQ